jgi:hypothetical protein
MDGKKKNQRWDSNPQPLPNLFFVDDRKATHYHCATLACDAQISLFNITTEFIPIKSHLPFSIIYHDSCGPKTEKSDNHKHPRQTILDEEEMPMLHWPPKA